jgi:adenylylsulfate kinase
MADSHVRTIAKSLSWRFGGFIMTVAVAWAVTGKPGVAASIGLADTLIKVVAYYLHERMWLRIRFGQPRQPEYDI